MLRLDDLIGKKVMICPKKRFRDADTDGTLYTVKLHGVEVSGVWIESPELARIAKGFAHQEKKPVFFLPHAQIEFLLAFSLHLDEKSLGT